MKYLPILRAMTLLALPACSPFSPGRDLFATGRDARVYNPATGRYEWPDAPARPRPPAPKPQPETPQPSPPEDTREYNPQKGRFE